MNRFKDISGERLRGFVTDLYADLRDRRLLPLVALLIVGIVAAPILLKDKDETPPAPPPIASSSTADAASFAVVPANPGLRSPGKRLGDRTPKNPFQPQVVEAGEESAGGESSSGAGGGAESRSVTVTEEKTTDTVTPAPVHYVPVPVPVSFGIDALIGVPGNPHEVQAIRPQTKLPSPKNPVVIYMGPSKDKKHALFLPSSQVLSYTGPVHCAAEKAYCQLLEVGIGAPVNFLYGAQERHLTLTVERFVPIEQLPHGKERVIRGK